MIVAISKFKIHPFLSIMGVSLILGLVAGIPLVDRDRIGRELLPVVWQQCWSRISVHSPVLASYYSWSINRKHSGRDRSCIETCRHGHPSGWKKPSGVGYGLMGMGCFHSGIL